MDNRDNLQRWRDSYKEEREIGRAEGFRAGQEHALKWALLESCDDGKCSFALLEGLARLQAGGTLDAPPCPRCGEPGWNAAVGCDKCGDKNLNPEGDDG